MPFQPDAFQPDAFETETYRVLIDSAPASDELSHTTSGVANLSRDLSEDASAPEDSLERTTSQPRGLDETTTVSEAARVANSEARVTQVGTEALVGPPPPDARITQAGVEAMVSPPPPHARITQVGAEALVKPIPDIRITQAGIEAVGLTAPTEGPETAALEDTLPALNEDTFEREVAEGWGDSDFGPAWEFVSGLPSTFSVSGGRARATYRQTSYPLQDKQRVWLPFSGSLPIDFTTEYSVSPGTGTRGVDHYWQIVSHNGLSIWDVGINFDWEGGWLWAHVSTIANRPGYPGPVYQGGQYAINAFIDTPAVDPETVSVRIQIVPGELRAKLWKTSSPEPADWFVTAWRAGPTFDYFSDALWDYSPSSPAGLQLSTNQSAASGGATVLPEVERIVFHSGLSSATDSIEHEIGVIQFPGSLTDSLTTTDAIAFVRGVRRAPTDDVRIKDNGNVPIPVWDWIHVRPSEEEMAELGIFPGYHLYDFFDRDLPENELGVASSGWHYPRGGQTTAVGNTPLFIVSDVFAIARGGIWRGIPSAARMGVQFDMLAPVYGRGYYVSVWGQNTRQRLDVYADGTGADLGRWLTFNVPTLYAASGNQNLVFDLDGDYEHWRGQWLRVRAVFPELNGDIYGLKVWPVDEEEPEGWAQYVVQTSAHTKFVQTPELSLTASVGTTTPAEADRATVVIDNLQLFDPISLMPGGPTEYYRTTESVTATHWHHPDDFYTSASDNTSTWVPDMVLATVRSPDVILPVDTDTVLTEDAPSGSSTVVVSDPTGTDTTAPVHVVIGGGIYEVISTSGSTLTLDRPLPSTFVAGTPVRIRPVPTSIVVGGVDITRFVDFRATRLQTYANGQVGEGEIRIKDVDRTRSITTGAEIIVRHRGIRVWGGYVKQVERSYAFSYGRTGQPAPRFLTIRAADYNILFRARRLFNKSNPLDHKADPWPVGTSDATAISYMIHNYLDLTGDGIGFDIRVSTTVAPFEEFTPAHADGTEWGTAMNIIIDRTRAVYYIDPDKILRYVDDSTQQSRFGYDGLSDQPDGVNTIGYRSFELDSDATKMANDVMVWGYSTSGQETDQLAFWREQNTASIISHGRWQLGEVRGDMYKQESVQRRAETWVLGSAYNRRGHKDDRLSVRCTVFVPYFRVGDVVEVENTSFGFSDLIPIRGAVITFPTPFDIRMDLTISHEIDPPWNTFEWWLPPPRKPEEPDPPIVCPVDIYPEYEPEGPNRAWVSTSPPSGQTGWLTWISNRLVGARLNADGSRSWIWIEDGKNYKGYILDPTFTEGYYHSLLNVPYGSDAQGVTKYRRRPILHDIQKKISGYHRYTFGGSFPYEDFQPATLQSRNWERISVKDPDSSYTGQLEVTLRLDWQIEAWNSWHKYWMGGVSHGYSLPLGAEKLSFNDSHQDGDWPDPFHIEGLRDIPDLIDMTSDLINGEDEYDANNHGKTYASGTIITKRIMTSGGSVQMGAQYTGEWPHDATNGGHNDWEPSGGRAVLFGQWVVVSVRRVRTTLLTRQLEERDDGTSCVSIPGSGDITMLLQKTNHPSDVVYRFPGAYIRGTTRVYVDGVLQMLGVDYFETDPGAGYITLANPTNEQVTGSFYIGGGPVANLSGLSFILPVSGPSTATFGPQTSLWPPAGWHGTYYEHFHNGHDFGVVTGTPVYAAASGTVMWETQSAGGMMIHIYHAVNVRTTYAHLSGRVVAHGSWVAQGALIGYSGASGIVTGAHLHWGVSVNGIPENPMGLL